METKVPVISVLMPAYNAEKYIAESIESILNQTFTDFEFIIIDDCSTDKTWEIIQEYADKDKRIITLKNEKNLGIAGNRNKLVSLAKGKYIVWQDADDISMPYRIEHQYDFMEKNPEVGISGGYLLFFDESRDLCVRKYASSDAILRKKIFRYSPVSQGAAIIRKSIINNMVPFDVSLKQAEDLDLSFRIGRLSSFANIQEVVLKYRQHDKSVSFEKIRENIKYTLEVRKRAMKKYDYDMTISDSLFYLIAYVFQFMPQKISYYVFNFFRNNDQA